MKEQGLFLLVLVGIGSAVVLGLIAVDQTVGPLFFVNDIWKSSQPTNQDKELFERKCAFCHGKSGTRRRFGAADLTRSTLDDRGYFNIIMNGRRIMPAWKNKLSKEQVFQLIEYIKTFRK